MAAAALALLALVLRLAVLRALPVIETDGVRYVELARQFQATGSPLDPLFPPLYPVLIALVHPLAGEWEAAGRLVSALLGAAVVMPAWALARRLLGPGPAILAAAVLAVHPALVRSGAAVLVEATYTFVIVLAVASAWAGLQGAGRGWLPASGLLCGLASLARPEAAVYAGGLAALVAGAGLRRGAGRAGLAWGAAVLGAFALPALPYLAYLRGSLGHWTLSGKVAHNLAHDYGGTPGPGALAWKLLENLAAFQKYALPELLPGLLALVLLPGLLRRAGERDWACREGVLLLASLPPAVALLFHVETRVFLPALPFLLPLAAAGVLAVADWLARWRPSPLWRTGLAVLVLAALMPGTLRPVLRPDPGDGLYRDAGGWVARTQSAEATVMDRKPFVAFYSGRRRAPLAPVGPEALAAVARDAGAALVVLDSRWLGDRLALLPLLYAPPPPGLTVLRDFDASPGVRLRVLGVRPRG